MTSLYEFNLQILKYNPKLRNSSKIDVLVRKILLSAIKLRLRMVFSRFHFVCHIESSYEYSAHQIYP